MEPRSLTTRRTYGFVSKNSIARNHRRRWGEYHQHFLQVEDILSNWKKERRKKNVIPRFKIIEFLGSVWNRGIEKLKSQNIENHTNVQYANFPELNFQADSCILPLHLPFFMILAFKVVKLIILE